MSRQTDKSNLTIKNNTMRVKDEIFTIIAENYDFQKEISDKLGVRVNSVYQWGRRKQSGRVLNSINLAVIMEVLGKSKNEIIDN